MAAGIGENEAEGDGGKSGDAGDAAGAVRGVARFRGGCRGDAGRRIGHRYIILWFAGRGKLGRGIMVRRSLQGAGCGERQKWGCR